MARTQAAGAMTRTGNAGRGPKPFLKIPSGINGLDAITGGGLPKGRPTLLAGAAGSGKTLFGMEFLVRGAQEHGEPGVFIAFEERAEELIQNVASMGFDLPALIARRKLVVDHVRVERSEIEETGEYDLEGLFIRLGHAVESIGARRVVLDTIESLFAGLKNEAILRAELRRLFGWLKDRGLTALITAERGEGTLTRHGLEEYVADCVIVLDHRITEQVSTRRMRIVKYRGSRHGTNEYPFLIGDNGIFLEPITAKGLSYDVSAERISTGIERLDALLGGKGFYRGSSVLVTGTPGTGKSSLAATFAHAACARGERVLYFAFEEGSRQIYRNMRSIGMDLLRWEKAGLLTLHASRPTGLGLEAHLLEMHTLAEAVKPAVVIIDPISNMTAVGRTEDVSALLARLIDFYKSRGITSLFTSLVSKGAAMEETSGVAISSLMDTWLLLQDIENGGERNRGLFIIKSRGMAHSNQIREFVLTDRGIELKDVSLSAEGVLLGSARAAQEARERTEMALRREESTRRRRLLAQKGKELAARIAALEMERAAQEAELKSFEAGEMRREKSREEVQREMARMRKADVEGDGKAGRKGTAAGKSGGPARGRSK